MKKAQRAPYLGLTQVKIEAHCIVGTEFEHPFRGGPLGLCHFCKYAKWEGPPGIGCGEAWLACTHPLSERELWEPHEVWSGMGSDCWGFRPEVDIDEAADILGIYLRGEWI